MSGALAGAGSALAIGRPILAASGIGSALGPFGALIVGNQRQIGTIIPDVVVTEHHVDRVQVTQHPVADNTAIQDHAFALPKTLTMQCGWSNSSLVGSAIEGFSSGGGFSDLGGAIGGAASSVFGAFTEQRVRQVYDRLLKLQADREPFAVTTGKRTYDSMLITELSVTTDRHSEYALILSCTMQEIIRVKTKTAAAPSQQQQVDPKKTAPTDEKGTVQPAVRPSALTGGWIERTLRSILPAGVFSPSAG